MPQTLLGFDFGRLRIGVAVGNTVTRTARALTIVDSEPLEQRWKAIASLVEEWRPDALIVGRPAVPAPHGAGDGDAAAASNGQTEASDAQQAGASNGREAEASGARQAAESNVRETAARCERFARQLAGRFGLKVELVDESGTSLEAAAALVEARRGAAGSGDAGVHASARSHRAAGAGAGGRRRRAAHPDADDAEAAAIILRQYLFCR